MYHRSPLERPVIVMALDDMFMDSHYNICTVDNCLKIARMHEPQCYDMLRVCHCINYSKMQPELRDSILRLTADIFAPALLSHNGYRKDSVLARLIAK